MPTRLQQSLDQAVTFRVSNFAINDARRVERPLTKWSKDKLLSAHAKHELQDQSDPANETSLDAP